MPVNISLQRIIIPVYAAEMERPHPLERWLAEHDMSVQEFAEIAGVSFTTIYGQLRDDHTASLRVMQAIEAATKGKVTVQMQSDWFEGW